MRQIKFRAWNNKHKYMDDTVFIRTCDGAVFDVPSVRFDTPNTEVELSNDLLIMQFTGLTDINGVEIYEGDVVSAVLIDKSGTKNKYVGKVFYQEYEFCIETEDHFWPVASWHCVYECEVIGNIYQNPELLK